MGEYPLTYSSSRQVFNLKLTRPLKRDFIEITPGRFEEINILGPGQINGRKVCSPSLSPIKPRPPVREYAQKKGVKLFLLRIPFLNVGFRERY